VIGLPAGEAGERIHALVVPVGTAPLNADEILRRCALRLPAYMLPKSVEILASLPRTPNGKTDYRSLREARLDPLR
jgi:acyl-CoA synthetase (AMP-forming)/AMP-acid ligase II